MSGGGTDFAAALKLINDQLNVTDSGCKPVIIFITDGEGGDITNQLTKMHETHPKAIFLCMGVGAEVKVDFLRKLVRAANGGEMTANLGSGKFNLFYHSLEDSDMKNTFKKISSMNLDLKRIKESMNLLSDFQKEEEARLIRKLEYEETKKREKIDHYERSKKFRQAKFEKMEQSNNE